MLHDKKYFRLTDSGSHGFDIFVNIFTVLLVAVAIVVAISIPTILTITAALLLTVGIILIYLSNYFKWKSIFLLAIGWLCSLLSFLLIYINTK